VKSRTSTTSKIYDRVKVFMLVGCSPNHEGDNFRMWDPGTKRIDLSRDIIWLNKMHFNKKTEWVNIPRNNFKNNDEYTPEKI
jgi:hypothetical protein